MTGFGSSGKRRSRLVVIHLDVVVDVDVDVDFDVDVEVDVYVDLVDLR